MKIDAEAPREEAASEELFLATSIHPTGSETRLKAVGITGASRSINGL